MKTSKENPNHVAIIMDGNGTWSEKNNLQKKKRDIKKVLKLLKKLSLTQLILE